MPIITSVSPSPAACADVVADLGRRITAKRQADGLTETAAAEQLGVSSSTVARWEAGGVIGGSDLVIRVLRWL